MPVKRNRKNKSRSREASNRSDSDMHPISPEMKNEIPNPPPQTSSGNKNWDDEEESNGGWSDTSDQSSEFDPKGKVPEPNSKPDFAAQLKKQREEEEEYSSDEDNGDYVSPGAHDQISEDERRYSKSALGPATSNRSPRQQKERKNFEYNAPAPSMGSVYSSERRYSPGMGYVEGDHRSTRPAFISNSTGIDPYRSSAQYISNDPQNDPHYKAEQDPRNAKLNIQALPVHNGTYPDAESSMTEHDLERGTSKKTIKTERFEESFVYAESEKRNRRTVVYLLGCLGCALVALAALTGGIVGVILYREDREDNPAPAPGVAAPPTVVTTSQPVAVPRSTPTPTLAPIVSTNSPVASTNSPVTSTDAPVASTSAPVVSTSSPVVTTESPIASTGAPVVSGPTFGGGGSVSTAAPVVAPSFGGGNPPAEGGTTSTGTPTASPVVSSPSGSGGDLSFVTNQVLFNNIIAASSDGGTAVSTNGSPQNNAFIWLQNDSFSTGRRLQGISDDRVLQRYALACLYFSAGGGNWNRKEGWLDPVDECAWHTDAQGQVNCDTENRIRIVQFTANNVSGTIPAELSMLDSLVTLVMDSTNDSDGLTGGIPASFSSFSSLVTCRFHGHKFTQPLPDDLFSSWPTAAAVDFFNSEVPGQIPNSIGDLSAATRILMSGNKFSGTIPTSIGMMTELITLSLDNNEIGGPIPTQVGTMESLTGLYLQDNKLSGNIPSEIQFLDKLKAGVNLANNQLSGPIPDIFTDLTRLRAFIVNNNTLTGVIPPSIELSVNMRELMLQDNSVTGSIPEPTCVAINSRTTNLARVDCDEVTCSCCDC